MCKVVRSLWTNQAVCRATLAARGSPAIGWFPATPVVSFYRRCFITSVPDIVFINLEKKNGILRAQSHFLSMLCWCKDSCCFSSKTQWSGGIFTHVGRFHTCKSCLHKHTFASVSFQKVSGGQIFQKHLEDKKQPNNFTTRRCFIHISRSLSANELT